MKTVIKSIVKTEIFNLHCPHCGTLLSSYVCEKNIEDKLEEYRNYRHCIFCGDRISWDIKID